MMLHKDTALAYLAAGLSVVPCDVKTKFPTCGKWKPYQEQRASEQLVRQWFSRNNRHIGLICGPISGNLEMIDFDNKGNPDADTLYQAWAALVEEIQPGLVETLPLERTQSGGYHLFYRCSSLQGNRKLATRQATPEELKRKPEEKHIALIETRGKGGFVVCAPSRGYTLLRGNLESIPVITPQQRDVLIGAALAQTQEGTGAGGGFDRPGDAYNEATGAAALVDLLTGHGWAEHKTAEHEGRRVYHLTRPGKSEGTSATVNYVAGCLYVWSSSVSGFEPGKAYTPFAVYAALKHNGDFSAASRDLAGQGYGAPRPAPRAPQVDQGNGHLLTTANRTDEGNAECFVGLRGDVYRYCGTRGQWLRWNGAYWQIDDRRSAERDAIEMARQRYHAAAAIDDLEERKRIATWAIGSESQAKASATLKAAEKHLITLIDDYDRAPLRCAAENTTLDLSTCTAQQPDRADLLSMALGTAYDAGATCPKWEQFISEVFSHDTELIRYVQRAVGYSLTGDTGEQKLFLCYGIGANGKSVFLDTIAALLGDYAAAAAFDTFDANKRSEATNDLAMLKGKRFVTITESEQDKRLAEARVKQITGGDSITCRFLHREFFTYKPSFKIWLAMNHLPTIRGTDRGIWRRIQVVPFLENFEDRANKHLARELLAELPGILNWALAGLKDWHTHGLGTCQAVECATQDYKADQDKIGRWLGECTVQAPQAVVSVQDAWNSYKRWCDDSNVFAGSKKAWVSELAQRGYESQKLQHKRQYIGIGLMPEDDSGTEGTEGTVNHGSTREQNSPKEKPENASLASLASPDDTEPDKAGEEPPYTGGDMPPADTHQTAQDIRLQVVGAIKAGNDDALARLLPRLRAISERAYLDVCAKYNLHNQEQRQ